MLKTKSFAQNKLFGLFLASSLFFTSSLYAQNPLPTCTPFCFEICKVLPTPNLFPSTPTNPSAFQAYYKVKLKVLPNNPNILMLPLSWNFNYLAFSGKLSVNGFTSRIDVEQTKIFSQSSGGMINPFYGPPTAPYLNVTEDGDVTWILGNIGNTGNCTGGEPGITLNFPPGQSEITLFTIVVEGVSGDIINFIDLSAEVKDCNTYGCPNGSIPIIGCQGQNNYLVSFPIQTCNPDKSISFEMVQLQNNSLIAVYLNNSPIGGVIKQCDMVIHILPQMNSINNLKLKAIEINGGPIIKRKETIENNDGSWDIYVVIGGFTAVNPKVALFGISIEGVINLSQGAHFICSMSPGRGVFPAGGGASVVCALTSTMAELVLPGYGPCANMLKLSATRYSRRRVVMKKWSVSLAWPRTVENLAS